MNLRSRAAVTVSVLLAGSVLAACGGDEPEAAPDASSYVEAMASAWKNAEDTKVSDAQARCWGQKMVDRLGITRLAQVGTSQEFGRATVALDLAELKLNSMDAEAVYEDFRSCGGNLGRDKAAFLGGLGLNESITDCVGDSMDESIMKRFFVTSVTDSSAAAAELFMEDEKFTSAVEQCVLDDPEFAASLG